MTIKKESLGSGHNYTQTYQQKGDNMEYTYTYEYLVAYAIYTDDSDSYIGRSFLTLRNPIMKSEDIEEIEETILGSTVYNAESILITNYQLIRVLKTKKQQRRKQKNDDTTNDK